MRITGFVWFVVSDGGRNVYVNGGATRRQAIKCFMKEWGTKKGAGSTWRWWYRNGARVVKFRVTEAMGEKK
jgi:hypothetical protein